MRVFYVEPSDNGNYCIEAALRAMPVPPEQLDLALFRGLRVPLEPVNFDPAEQGFANLNAYDLVILAGLDPIVLTPQDTLALMAFVERGGGLMLVGGTHSFSNAEGTYFPLAVLLPVQVLRALDVEVNALPQPTHHPIARGLPEPLGYIGKVHPVEVKPGAEVALTVAELPLVVAGSFGYGRVVVVGSYPECDQSEYGWFFTGDAFDDFLRNAVAWLTKQQPPAWIEGFTLPVREVTTGSDHFGKVLLKAAEPTAARLLTRLTRQGETVHEDSTRLHVTGAHEALFSFRVPSAATADGLHYVSAALSDLEGRLLDYREVALVVVNPTRVGIELAYGRRCFAPGDAVRVRAHAFSERRVPPHSVTLEPVLLDAAGQEALRGERRTVNWAGSGYEEAEFDFALPQLTPGPYRLVVELRFGEGLADTAEEDLHVLPRRRGDDRLPLIAEGGYHLERVTTERAVADLAAAGVNVLSLPGPVAHEWGERPHWELMLGHAEEQALRAGLGVVHHHRSLVPGVKPSEPLAPCPLTPEFGRALEELTRPILVAASCVPGLLFHEILPQAAVRWEQLCRCEACQAAYARTFESEMPTGDVAALPDETHHALCSFVSSTWWHVLSAAVALRDEAAPGVRLSLSFGAECFLRESRRAPYCDAFSWARAADAVEVAPEPDAATFALSLSGHRTLCAAEGKPFGALLDLASKGLPPAEAAFTALAHGASHLRVAENPRFLFWRQQPPLGAALGRLFARIAKAGPLLACSQRPRAQVALFFPFTQVIDGGSDGLLDAFEVLRAAGGEVDLVHQRLAKDPRVEDYEAVALLGTRMLPKKSARELARFVEQGGLLLADHAEVADEKGRPLPWPEHFFGAEETPIFESVTRRRRAYGAGRTTLFSPDIGGAYRRALEREDVLAARALSRVIADGLADHGVFPRLRSDNPAVELGLRLCGGTHLVVAVNHSDEPQAARVELRVDARVACAYDLLTGEELPVAEGEPPALAVTVPPRDGAIWVLYPERPFSLRLELAEAQVSQGGELRYTVSVVNEAGQPIRASHILRVFVTDPDGAERPDLGGERLTAGGGLEAVEPIAVNERPGRWTLCVTDVLTRRIVRRAFDIVAEPSPREEATAQP